MTLNNVSEETIVRQSNIQAVLNNAPRYDYLRIFMVRHIVLITLLKVSIQPNLSWAQEVFDFTPTQTLATQTNTPTVRSWPTIPLLKQYHGEETRGVKYLSTQDRRQALVRVHKGLLIDQQNYPLNQGYQSPFEHPLVRFPEQPSKNQNLEHGFAIYVMNAQGQILVSFNAERHHFHHSSLVAGGPVAAAGEMIIFAGKLYAINNRSGHYRPPPKALERVLKVLTRMGIKMGDVLIKRYGSDF